MSNRYSYIKSTVPLSKNNDSASNFLYQMTFGPSLVAQKIAYNKLTSPGPNAPLTEKKEQNINYGVSTYSDLTAYNTESKLKPY